jgi:hypothetical protein
VSLAQYVSIFTLHRFGKPANILQYVKSSSTYTTTVTLAPVTTWVTCYESHTPVESSTVYATPTSTYVPTYTSTYIPTYTHKTSSVAVTYVATATKPGYPANSTTTYAAAAFTGAASNVQSSVLVSGLVGLLALIPAFFL